MKKYVIISIISILMILCSASSVLAKTVKEIAFEHENLTVFDNSISPLYEITCPAGKHNMKSNGIGIAKDHSGNTVFRGYCYQCSHCYLVLCSERDPRDSHTLGKYCFYMAYEPIGTVGCIIDNAQIETFNGDIRTDSFWQGFVFVKGL